MKIKNALHGAYSLVKLNSYLLIDSFKTKSAYINSATDFVNKNNFLSSSPYFIWVDTKNFKTNIFRGSKNNWTLINSFLCTIGKPTDPTIKGIFWVGVKGYSFGEDRGFKCLYYTQIKGDYLFHSIPYNLDGTIRDNRLGMMLTDGCVRLSTPHAKWIYNTIPIGTTIFIN